MLMSISTCVQIQFKKYDPTQELIFPPFLASNKYVPQPLLFESARVKWYRPVSLEQLVELKVGLYPVTSHKM